jgi:capsid protein
MSAQAIPQTFLDRVINWLSPKWGSERLAYRQLQASYQGGVPTRTSERWSQTEGFRFTSISERSQIASARDRGYQAYKNNPVAKTLIKTEVDNVIGDGLNYQPSTSSPEWNREAQDRYYQWLDGASVRGGDIHSGCELPRLIWDRSRVAGDVGWILVSRGFESRIQVVQSENIATPPELTANLDVVDGIRFDAFGAPAVFYIRSRDERGGMWTYTPIDARDFVFLPHLTEANSARGETAFMTVFDLLSHLDRYVDGVALAAWMATVFGIIFKQADAGKQVRLLGNAFNSAGQIQKAITLENGMAKYIGEKDEVVQVQAHQPMQNTPDFIRAILRLAGMVFGMPLEAFARDMSTCNFASARIGLLPFYRQCRINGQGTFGPRWSRTIRWWLSRERQRLDSDPKKWVTPFPPDYFRHELLSNAWEYTDPVSEVQGDLLQCDAGFKSHQMVISERGRDAERITREREEWQKKTEELPQLHSTMTRDKRAGVDADTDDQLFKREVVKSMLTDPTINDVIANKTDIETLMTDAGMPLNPGVKSGEGAPMLPIIAAVGPLVDGDTIQGPDGKLVGGDIEDPANLVGDNPADPNAPPPKENQNGE